MGGPSIYSPHGAGANATAKHGGSRGDRQKLNFQLKQPTGKFYSGTRFKSKGISPISIGGGYFITPKAKVQWEKGRERVSIGERVRVLPASLSKIKKKKFYAIPNGSPLT